jgi:hypothetical protein
MERVGNREQGLFLSLTKRIDTKGFLQADPLILLLFNLVYLPTDLFSPLQHLLLSTTLTMKSSLLTLALAPLATAHFLLQYPTSRGFDEDTMPEFPCGGMSQSSNRTQLPISGSFPVALKMGHSQTAVEVLLALGSNPGNNYNITLVKTFQVTGLGEFCLPHVEFSADTLGVNITDGMNATLQVQSNGDPSGGLYAVSLNWH